MYYFPKELNKKVKTGLSIFYFTESCIRFCKVNQSIDGELKSVTCPTGSYCLELSK